MAQDLLTSTPTVDRAFKSFLHDDFLRKFLARFVVMSVALSVHVDFSGNDGVCVCVCAVTVNYLIVRMPCLLDHSSNLHVGPPFLPRSSQRPVFMPVFNRSLTASSGVDTLKSPRHYREPGVIVKMASPGHCK